MNLVKPIRMGNPMSTLTNSGQFQRNSRLNARRSGEIANNVPKKKPLVAKSTEPFVPGDRVCEMCPNLLFAQNKYCVLCQECVIKKRAARKERRAQDSTNQPINSNTTPTYPDYSHMFPPQAPAPPPPNPNPLFMIPAFDYYTKHCVAQTNLGYETVLNHVIRVVLQFESDYYVSDDYGGCEKYSYIVRTLTVDFPVIANILTETDFDDDDNLVNLSYISNLKFDPSSISNLNFHDLSGYNPRADHLIYSATLMVKPSIPLHSTLFIKD